MGLKLNYLRDMAYDTAKAHGWHEPEQDDEVYLMLVITEVAEAVNADRKNKRADKDSYADGIMEKLIGKHLSDEEYERVNVELFEKYIKDTLEDELADVAIRLLDLAGLRNIDFGKDSVKSDFTAVFNSKAGDVLLNDCPFPMWAYALTAVLTQYSVEISLDWVVRTSLYMTFGFAKKMNIDLMFYIGKKMKYNQHRAYKHGGCKY